MHTVVTVCPDQYGAVTKLRLPPSAYTTVVAIAYRHLKVSYSRGMALHIERDVPVLVHKWDGAHHQQVAPPAAGCTTTHAENDEPQLAARPQGIYTRLNKPMPPHNN